LRDGWTVRLGGARSDDYTFLMHNDLATSRPAMPSGPQTHSQAVAEDAYAAMKQHLGFTEADAANLRALAAPIAGSLSRVVDRFYAAILADDRAMRVFRGGHEQIDRQRERMAAWLRGLFDDKDSRLRRERSQRVGQAHVEVSLPQHYMITGMEIIRSELEGCVRGLDIPNVEASVTSVNKMLALELGAMLESYKSRYAHRIQHREREAVEERLTRAEHMAHLGQLAASLAHAIKNPLAGISGAIQIIRGTIPAESPHRRVIDEMLAQIDRLDATVKDLLVYSRPRAPARVSIDLNELIARVLNVLREEPSLRRLRVRHVRQSTLPRLQADERQLEQVVMNLLLNAADASSEGDKVTITTGFERSIGMRIADEGLGMTEEVLARAFEPFHTTKTKGTGLGLSICRQIVEAHGGQITIESRRHRGTTVNVELPVDEG
jgi:signal transduction histidine kinase